VQKSQEFILEFTASLVEQRKVFSLLKLSLEQEREAVELDLEEFLVFIKLKMPTTAMPALTPKAAPAVWFASGASN